MNGLLSTRRTPALVTRPSHGVQRVSWEELGPEFIRTWGYPRGKFEPEHLTVYGKTRSGKTYLVIHLLQWRAHVRGSHCVVLVTKKSDALLSGLGWPVRDSYPFPYGTNQGIVWIRDKGLTDESRKEQGRRVERLLGQLWRPNSNVVLYVDELPYVENSLGHRRIIETYYREGAGNGITVVSGMQRPARVSREAHSEASWTAAFRPKDADDRDRVAEVFGDRARYRIVLEDLDRHKREFLLHHDLTGESYITALPSGLLMAGRTR